MLRIITCVLIGRMFSNLAKQHGKNHWVSGILSGVATLIIQLLFEVLIALMFIDALQSNGAFGASLAIALIAMGIGTAVMYGVFLLLKKSWTEKSAKDSNLLDN